MRPIRVYADTSIYGGWFDEEFSEASTRFLNQVRSGRFLLVTSPLAAQEVALAPREVPDLFTSLLARMQIVPVTSEAEEPQQAYVDAGIVPPPAKTDALHVALATVSGCSMTVSWNFRHIVHFQRMAQYNLVNLRRGYPQIGIFSPADVIDDGNEDL